MGFIYSIIIGYNNEASINDAIMIENLLLKLQKKNKKILDPLCFTNNVNIDILRSKINEINNNNFDHIILFYYSGHGNLNSIGYNNLDGNQINSLIETGKKSEFNKIVILDCCHANSIKLPIENNLVISSCDSSELSSESFSEIRSLNENNKQYMYSKKFKRDKIEYYNFQIGIFTYNFCEIFGKDNFLNNSIWTTIKFISNQKMCVEGNKNLLKILYK